MEEFFFYLFASVTVGLILLMIVQDSPVASAMCLVGAFFGLAGLYVLLSAPFVAVMQILVYAGAIMVLFIFVIMLLNLKEHELVYDRMNLKRVVVLFIGLGLFAFLTKLFLRIPKVEFAAVEESFGTVKEVGRTMFVNYLIPFELIGILLLVGLVGAVLLGRREE
jgi:NADH-quinone oxidoreductase subunit J